MKVIYLFIWKRNSFRLASGTFFLKIATDLKFMDKSLDQEKINK